MGADGTVNSVDYDDVYHSRSGAVAQARHVFLDGNGLLGSSPRWRECECFTILETGFGAGINFLSTWSAWRDSGSTGRLHFVSIEKHPLANDTLAAILASHATLWPLAQVMLEQWPLPISGLHRLHFDEQRVTLTLVFGDAATVLPKLNLLADALYLDGFSPAKNPDMWSARVLGAITRLCKDQATLATWCVAGEVKRHLGYRGWVLERTPGFAAKHHMLRGTLKRPHAAVSPAPTSWPRQAIVLGAGMAGCSLSERLCARGWQVTLIDRQSAAAQEASGNPAGILLPRLARDDAMAARLARSAFLYALHTLRRLGNEYMHWDDCGVLQMADDAADDIYQREVIEHLNLPGEFVTYLNREDASSRTGLPLKRGGWWFPSGGWVAPPTYCQALIERAGKRLTCIFGAAITQLRRRDDRWQVLDAHDRIIAEAPQLVLANAQSINALLIDEMCEPLPIESIRGQVSFLPVGILPNIRSVVCGAAYITPAATHFACVGATFDRNDTNAHVRPDDHQRNLATLSAMLTDPFALGNIAAESLSGRTGFRCMSHDKLPMVGALAATATEAPSHSTTLGSLPRVEGLHALVGLGARGLLWAPMAAELLACQLSKEPLPLERAMVDALDPGRFLLRSRRGTKHEVVRQPTDR